MRYLKFYKPIIFFKIKKKQKNTKIMIKIKKNTKINTVFNKLQFNIYISNPKVCFSTFKYKTQVNVLKQSRFFFRHELTFNKNHSFTKYTH